MSSKRNHATGGKACVCDKCGAEANSTPGKRHRRCPGQMGAPLKSKHVHLPTADRGKWS